MSIQQQHTVDSIEFASRDEIEALQLSRLKWTLTHAYENVPMYRKKFNDAGVHPDDFKQLSDIEKFPYTTKQDLRENYPFNTFAVPMNQIIRIHASSGTTGRPTVVGYTQQDIDNWADLIARSLRSAGAGKGDKIHVAYGYGLFTGGLGAHYGAERLGAAVIPMSGGQTEKQAQLIADFKPDVIMVTPSYCLSIIDELEKIMGGDASKCSLRLGVFGAEPWTEALRTEIETRLGIKALDIYGLSEVMGPGVAMECADSGESGPTIWEDHFYPEIISPDTLQPLAAGDNGELVFTTLTKEAMPVIRYRTRDLTHLMPGVNRHMRRIGKITGRSDDMMIIRGVNVFPSQIEEQIMQFKELSPHYQLEISRKGNMDSLSIRVELKQPDALTYDERCNICHNLKHRIKSMVGVSTRISIVNCGDIPRSQGKAERVIDTRIAI
ncbi:phenylacetate--CoA ligase [Providencia stuartii]|uniref:Phenylacetate-coenzyme A ligase n=1 Tax=Providencia manganoxydans TaxID=2923283 RepID=A0ABX7AG17_9GAMM|nr:MULTISPECIES: phenylacetate--CoA ligase PaaK [Providencia]ELR5299982.1 phenylacetate--CoA ligase [Providencia stuartii]MDW7589003.1 phenylacetate--CoA ligase PaaK [Providencia sp. 2023EL-00965]MDX4946708.1 phenylacetate--CoA ligase PaaK [Providencia manganoxydans]QQO62672.1 phenylacetate--CoA ligase [Providencia manganoxydans]HEF8771404.1 phenylacetate--CoA ligase [Providencia stuartii]